MHTLRFLLFAAWLSSASHSILVASLRLSSHESAAAAANSSAILVGHRHSHGHRSGDGKRVVLNHLAKCAGRFIKGVMRQSLPAERLKVIPERHGLTSQDVSDQDFIVGLMRNPYEYYVSLWAFTALEDNGLHFRQALSKQQQNDVYPHLPSGHLYGELPVEIAAFGRWLRAVSSQQLGLLSLRFFGHYLDQGSNPGLQNGTWNLQTVPTMLSSGKVSASNVNARLEAFSPNHGPISCWIRTESVRRGTQDCLRRYEAEVGSAVVNWTTNGKAFESEPKRASPHVPCKHFYDENLRRFVAESDRQLIRLFNYKEGCED